MKFKYSKFNPYIPVRFNHSVLSHFDFSKNEALEGFISKWITYHGQGFCLYGKIGIGKTMLISIISRILNAENYQNCIFISFNDFINTMRNFEIRGEWFASVMEFKYIIIDDLLKNLNKKIYTNNDKKNLSIFIDTIYNENKILICTTMYDKEFLMKHIGDTSDDASWDNVLSRIFHMCDFIKVEGLDRRI